KPHAPMHLHLQFSFRGHTGGMMARHPNLDEAVAAFRAYLPPRHRIIYPADLPPEPAPSPAAIEA
ncbi:MAG: hypothetical protein E7K72_26580, partial [Roseomonas mucosa]|nr:hypothetical protein [Roseomonas mucosa]